MTTPGEQLDQNTADIAKNQANLATLSARLLEVEAALAESRVDTIDEDPADVEIVSVVPDPSPTPPPAPVAEPEPEPTPDAIRFDLSVLPEVVTVGSVHSVPVFGVPDGETLWYHNFNEEFGGVLRQNVVVSNGAVELLVPMLGSENRQFQLQHPVTNDRNTRLISVFMPPSVSPPKLPPVDYSVPALAVETGGVVPRLFPGLGWSGPTQTPAQIGSVTERAIAHWNVVPEQEVGDGFTVGVIAHHLDGIDRVEIAADGGDWVRAQLGVNPRTRCEEYFVSLSLAVDEGFIKLRAIAYPRVGQPFVVRPLGNQYSKQDLTLYHYQVGEVLELDAGRHAIKPRNLPETGWLTIRPKPGVDRKDVILTGESRFWGSGRLKFENVTVELPWGGGGIMGATNEDDGAQVGNHVWFDNCRIYGEEPGRERRDQAWWIGFVWETATYTDCEISDMETPFHGHRGIDTLARNCYVHDIYEDIFRSGGLHVNIRIEDMIRDYVIDRQNLTTAERPHPDIWQLRLIRDTIIQDVTATENINAQGFFCGKVENVAMVRVNIDTLPPWRVYQPHGEMRNFLIQDSRLGGGVSTGRSSASGRVVYRRNVNRDGNPWTAGPDGVEVIG